MKKLGLIVFLVGLFGGVIAQNEDTNPYGGIYYNDHFNYRMYGANVLPRTDHTNLDTLTNVIKGDMRYDTLKNHAVIYDESQWQDISYGRVKDTVIELTSSQILDLNSTPITIVEAKGVGTLIQPLSAVIKYTYVTTPYTGGTLLRIGTNTGQDAYICQVLDATLSTIRTFTTPIHSTVGYSGSVENSNLELDSSTNPLGGDGTAKIWVKYQIFKF